MKIKDLTLKNRFDICRNHPDCFDCSIQGRFCLRKCSQKEMQQSINELERDIDRNSMPSIETDYEKLKYILDNNSNFTLEEIANTYLRMYSEDFDIERLHTFITDLHTFLKSKIIEVKYE